MSKTLIIADYDENFVNSVEDYLFANYYDEFEIRTISSKEKLEKFFSTDKKVDILLVNPQFIFEGLENQYINNILFISDNENENNYDNKSVYRFGELSSIYSKLNNSKQTNSRITEDYKYNVVSSKSRVLTLYSPVGGVGKSSIALAIASELSSNGKKVLYLNLENMACTNAYFEAKNNNINLSHIIEHIDSGSTHLEKYISNSLNMDIESKVYYINPPDNILSIEEMNPSDMKLLINTFANMNKFEYIIIDTNSVYDTLKKSIIDVSDKIILPITQNKISKHKIVNFLKFIDEEELHKFVPVINKYKEETENYIKEIGVVNSKFHIQGFIEYYDLLEEESSYIKIFTRNNPFSAAIKPLINF